MAFGTMVSLKSREYNIQQSCNCFELLAQEAPWPLALARDKAGSNIEARMAMMAITTNNSISVKPSDRLCSCRVWFASVRFEGALMGS
jgi:hypothetical protein